MNKKLPLVAGMLGAMVLTGCSTVPESQWGYNDRISRAQNIARTFGYNEDMFDSDAPEGYEGDGSFLLEGASLAASLDAASKINGFLPGVSGWGAVGIGLLGSLGQAVADRSKPHNHIGCVGYLPANQAKDEVEARKKMIHLMKDTLIQSTHDVLPNAEIVYQGDFGWDSGFLRNNSYGIAVTIIDPEIGCLKSEQLTTKDSKACYFSIHAENVKLIDGIPAMFNNADQPHYKLTHNEAGYMINTNKRLGERMDVAKWLANASKYLPEKNVYLCSDDEK